MREANASGPLGRVLRTVGGSEILDLLAERLSGADLTTLLLAVVRRRAGRLSASDVLRQYERDRFVGAAGARVGFLRAVEDVFIQALPGEWDLVELAPLVPLGAHSVLGTVDQNKVVTTVRGSEVAADPTNALALEAARRRRASPATRASDTLRLAALQRVTRAQRLPAQPGMFAHFELFGLVTAGRDRGSLLFERAALVDHLRIHVAALAALGAGAELRIAIFDPKLDPVLPVVESAFADLPAVTVVDDRERTSGRGYYRDVCFKVFTTLGAQRIEVADGGIVDWTQQLLQNRKERLFISGAGVDRFAIAIDPTAT